MKKTKYLFRIITYIFIFFVLISFSTIKVKAADDYPEKYKNAAQDSIIDEWKFYNRECTSFVAWCLNSRNGVAFNNWYGGVQWGNASNWGNAARSVGITVDNNPAVGSVGWSSSGHVVWISAVNGDSVTIEEYNYMCKENNYQSGRYHTRTVSKSTFSGFIHIKDMPTNKDPMGAFDSVTGGLQTIRVSGWAIDFDDTDYQASIHVYVGGPAGSGASCYVIKANKYRSDNGIGYHGFDDTIYVSESGTVDVYVYALNNVPYTNNPCLGMKTVTIQKDTTKPKISDVKVTNISKNGYTVTCKVSDNVGIDRVSFPTWTENNGQDDIFSNWPTNSATFGTISNGVATYYVKTSDHNGESNCYYFTHIYVWDKAGNVASVGQDIYSCLYVNVKDTPKKANYKVCHYVENLDGTYTKKKTETFSGKTNSQVSPSTLSYTGFTTPAKKTAKIKSDGSTVIKYYYNRNKYKLTWDLGGGKASGSYTKGTVYYGTKITAPSSVKKTGYVFKGWSITVPDKMPAKNVTIKAKWEAKNQKEVEAYVTRFYKVFLNRKPEKEGLDYWTENLISKKMTGADVARGFVLSKEMMNRKLSNEEFVTLMYKGFFDRVPDTGGYAYWLGLLEAGYPKEKIVAGFVNSQEFKNLCKKYNINPGTL